MLDLVDSASLLMRLEMEGYNFGQRRWNSLIELIEPRIDDHFLAFNDAHISMILSKSADDTLQQRHKNSLNNFIG